MLAIGVLLVSAVAAGALYQFIEARRSARAYVPPGRMVDVDGQRLHLVCAGTGSPTVVFESGIAASSLSWTRVLPGVATFTRACAYDRAGLAWSDPPRRPRTLARMIDELHTLLTNAAVPEPFVLVGHSFGAFLVCAYASQHPTDTAGIVLVDPPSEWHQPTREQARRLWGAIQLSRVGALLARLGVVRACLALLSGGAPGVPRNFVKIFGPTAARTLERLVGEVRKLPAEVLPIVQALWCQPKCFRSMADHLGALDETAAFVAGLTALPDVPFVVMSAGDQPSETIAAHRRLTRLSSQGRHVVAATGGHWIQFDEPELVISAIRDVVDRARGRTAA
jgi:pimeloyl-ACP methyl ester carboxylesterase